MNRINVTLHVIPSDVEHCELEDYDEIKHGKVLSNTNEIKVNKAAGGYSIVYDGDTLKRLNASVFVPNVVKLFQNNLPNTIVDMRIMYHYDTCDGEEVFEADVAEKIFEIDVCCLRREEPLFRYHRSESISDASEYYKEINESDDDNDDDYLGGEDDDDDDDFEDPFGFLDNMKGSKKSKGKPKFDSYGRSKVIKNAKNPKRAYRRHGLLIASDKEDLNRDEKIIKAFLKDFIPGNSEWKKDFRKDVLKRWLRMFAVSKKNIRQLEKEYRKAHSSNKSSSINTDKVLDFTRRAFNIQTDRWNDPSK